MVRYLIKFLIKLIIRPFIFLTFTYPVNHASRSGIKTPLYFNSWINMRCRLYCGRCNSTGRPIRILFSLISEKYLKIKFRDFLFTTLRTQSLSRIKTSSSLCQTILISGTVFRRRWLWYWSFCVVICEERVWRTVGRMYVSGWTCIRDKILD
jgi:hypothetical protein